MCTFYDGAALGSGAAEDDNVLDVVKGLEVRHAAIFSGGGETIRG